MRTPVSKVNVVRVEGGATADVDDLLVVEEPLEIRLGHGPLEDRKEFRLSVTMRTPGNDEELALGFLYTEGVISSVDEIISIKPCLNVKPEEKGNVVRAELRPDLDQDLSRWQRNFYTTSSCGVCGKSSLEAVRVNCSPIQPFGNVDAKIIASLPDEMRKVQTVFTHTGGIHAAALFDATGKLLILREDVGRHNAVDKVIGCMLQRNIHPQKKILLVSGRAGFELVQKCAVAGIPAMAAIGAPSSLAVDLAKNIGLTLIGFLRKDRFNIYT
jgi:FdhD protein